MEKVAIKGYLYKKPVDTYGDDFEMEENCDGTWTIWVDGEDIGEFQVVEENNE